MKYGSTVNLVSGRLVACRSYTCEIYREGSWQHLQNTTEARRGHSSAATEDAILLIGGMGEKMSPIYSTEWIPVDGSAAHPGSFTVRHGDYHCTSQVSDKSIVVTGGRKTYDSVTEYDLVDGTENALAPFGQQRYAHACGVYQDADNQQVS